MRVDGKQFSFVVFVNDIKLSNFHHLPQLNTKARRNWEKKPETIRGQFEQEERRFSYLMFDKIQIFSH